MPFVFAKRIPFYYVLVAMLFTGLISYFVFHSKAAAPCGEVSSITTPVNNLPAQVCSYTLPRLGGYRFVKPLMFAEQNCEAEKYRPLKETISQLIDKMKTEGIISGASVYVLDFDEEAWMSVNEQSKYSPGSLLKVPVLITYLRMSEETPGLLDRKIVFAGHDNSLPVPEYKSKSIVAGQSYSIRELLRDMIVYSDNDATNLLIMHVSDTQYLKTFTDLGLPPPEKGKVYPVSAKEFSVFMNVLYDGGYLTFADSEYAISLLTESDFKDGILKGIPTSVKAAHKYGEWGETDSRELHETAIIYMNKSPYLLTIMTKGNDTHKLSEALSSISKLTYEDMMRNN